MAETVNPFLKKPNRIKKNIKIIFCDVTDKNKALEEDYAKSFEDVGYEFTSACTTQKNGVVGQVFATLYYWVCMMMGHEVLHENLKTGIWTKCASSMTKLKISMVKPHEENIHTRRSTAR